jgi:RimJ/RimL family protein N-acetyltransferase
MQAESRQELHYPDPPISTAAAALRPWMPSDADAVVEACSDPVTQRFITEMPRPYTRQHAETFIARAAANLSEGRSIGLTITEPYGGDAIGAVTLHAVQPVHWYVGYWMTPRARNRGITTAAVQMVSRWAFADYPSLVRLSLYALPDNIASQRVAEKAGFTREGVLRAWDYASGSPQDVVMFSLLRTDLLPSAQDS